jgi:hypothetical protein
MLFSPNATVTIGKIADIPQAPSLNRPSAVAIAPDEAEPLSWTKRAQVRDMSASKINALQLTPNLNESGGAQTYSIFFETRIKFPAWAKPGEDVYVKFDNGASISGILAMRLGMSSFARENGLSTPYFVTERGSR